MPKTFITLGVTDLSPEKFKPVTNRLFIKPFGGLWASPYTPDEAYVSAWHRWCVQNGMEQWLTNDAVIFTLGEDANIFTIDSQEDLMRFVSEVGVPDNDFTRLAFWVVPDFEVAATKMQGVYLTEDGQHKTHMPLNHPDYNLYGWDCESLLLFNLDCIEQWVYRKLDIVGKTKKED